MKLKLLASHNKKKVSKYLLKEPGICFFRIAKNSVRFSKVEDFFVVHPYFDCLVYISFARFKCLLMVSSLILKLQLLVVLVGLCGGQASIFVSFRDAGMVWDIKKALFCFLMSFAFCLAMVVFIFLANSQQKAETYFFFSLNICQTWHGTLRPSTSSHTINTV